MVIKKKIKNKWCYRRPKGMMSYQWDLDYRLYQKQNDIIMYIPMGKWEYIRQLKHNALFPNKIGINTNYGFGGWTSNWDVEINSINASLELLVKEFRQKNNANEIYEREKVLLVPVKDYVRTAQT